MRSRFRQQQVWANLGFDVEESMRSVEQSECWQMFQSLLLSRSVPCVHEDLAEALDFGKRELLVRRLEVEKTIALADAPMT